LRLALRTRLRPYGREDIGSGSYVDARLSFGGFDRPAGLQQQSVPVVFEREFEFDADDSVVAVFASDALPVSRVIKPAGSMEGGRSKRN
jgi:hypothetical protein